MVWIFKKIFGLGILVAIIFFALQYPVGGHPLKKYLIDFYNSPIVQEAARQGKLAIMGYLRKDVGDQDAVKRAPESESNPPMDPIPESEKRELEKVLEKNN